MRQRSTRHNPPRPVQNAAFRRWFAESVVMDGSGQPLVVYHGTRSPIDFSAFETGAVFDDDGEVVVQSSLAPSAYLGPHFAVEHEIASAFALGRAAAWDRERHVARGKASGRVIPVVLSIKNPMRFDTEADMDAWIAAYGRSEYYEEMEWQVAKQNGVEPDLKNVTAKQMFGVIRLLMNQPMDDEPESVGAEVCRQFGESARDKLISMGHDGVYYANVVEGGSAWVALLPGSVKSATGNDGTWDGDDPDITS
jgi:hypothetical protein